MLAKRRGIDGVFITTEPSDVRLQPVPARRLPHAARTNVVRLCLFMPVLRRKIPSLPSKRHAPRRSGSGHSIPLFGLNNAPAVASASNHRFLCRWFTTIKWPSDDEDGAVPMSVSIGSRKCRRRCKNPSRWAKSLVLPRQLNRCLRSLEFHSEFQLEFLQSIDFHWPDAEAPICADCLRRGFLFR